MQSCAHSIKKLLKDNFILLPMLSDNQGQNNCSGHDCELSTSISGEKRKFSILS